MAICFTVHALAVMAERQIAREWVDRVLEAPEWEEPDPANSSLRRAFGRIAEFDDRRLRVVYHEGKGEKRVITVFFDRKHRPVPGKGSP